MSVMSLTLRPCPQSRASSMWRWGDTRTTRTCSREGWRADHHLPDLRSWDNDSEGQDMTRDGANASADCPASRLCVWPASSYGGTVFSATSTTATNTAIPMARSVWNRTNRAARLYSGTGGSGSSTCIPPGTKSGSVQYASASAKVLTGSTC